MTQSILLTNKTFPLVLMGSAFTALIGTPAMASTFSTEPIYQTILNYETQIRATSSLTGFDDTDIYYPESSHPSVTFPIALMLQGARVDKVNYSSFASQVASYGFLVAVPNHERTLSENSPPGLFPVQELVHDTLAFMKEENINSGSPIEGKVDVDNLGLLGHSFGGSVGLGAIQGDCFPIICTTEFTRPEALKAGIFYGTRFGEQDPLSPVPPIFNDAIPTGLIGGTLDGVIPLNKVLETYQQIQDPPKVLVNVIGANHYGITNDDITDDNGKFIDPMRPTLDQETATETIARWSGLFLRAHVLEDREAFNYVYNIGDAQDENVTVISAKVPESSDTWGIFLLGMGITIGSVVKGNTKCR